MTCYFNRRSLFVHFMLSSASLSLSVTIYERFRFLCTSDVTVCCAQPVKWWTTKSSRALWRLSGKMFEVNKIAISRPNVISPLSRDECEVNEPNNVQNKKKKLRDKRSRLHQPIPNWSLNVRIMLPVWIRILLFFTWNRLNSTRCHVRCVQCVYFLYKI